MKKNIIKASGIISFALAFSAVTGYAANEVKSIKSVKNEFYPAHIEIAVQENNNKNTESAPAKTNLSWDKADDGSSYTAIKEVKILNNSNSSNPAPAFIRVCLVPRWTMTLDGKEIDVTNTSYISEMGSFKKEIAGNSYTMGEVTFYLDEKWSENWIYNGDGYFYCRQSVDAGESTPLLLKSVSITAEAYSNIPADVTLEVDVLADSIQTEGQDAGETNALAERWGTPEVLGIQVADNDGIPTLEEYKSGGDINGQ